jgi:Matrixin
MLRLPKNLVFIAGLCLLTAFIMRAGKLPGDWTGNYPPCASSQELLKNDHMKLGVRLSTASLGLANAVVRAMNFWATILDMEWYIESSPKCALQIVDGDSRLFQSGQAARAQFPNRPSFQGLIAFNRQVVLTAEDQYVVSVHEVGHLLGLPHNPSAQSVMFFLNAGGPVLLDTVDLRNLAAFHKLRIDRVHEPRFVTSAKSD